MLRLSLIVLFICICKYAWLQNKFSEIEKKTYAMYVEGNWKSLSKEGEKYLKNNDYFYLRYRIGVAYYSIGNYFKSIKHLEKAIKYNSIDKPTKEYLLYSYINLGKELEAVNIMKKYKSEFSEKNESYLLKRLSKYIYSEAGYSYNNFNDKNKNSNSNSNKFIYEERQRILNNTYYHVGLNIILTKNMSLYNGYNNILLNNKKYVIYSINDTLIKYKSFQNEYYGSLSLLLKRNLKVVGSYHYIDVRSKNIFVTYDNFMYKTTNEDVRIDNNVISLSLEKTVNKLVSGINFVNSHINNKTQYQYGGFVVYYPSGNLNSYIGYNFSLHEENKNTSFINNVFVGGMLISKFKLWGELNYTEGDIYNYSEKNAFVVYNMQEIIKNRLNVSIILPVNKKLELSLRYYYSKREGQEIVYDNVLHDKKMYYYNNLILSGIKWKL